jgi:hypothetical protein
MGSLAAIIMAAMLLSAAVSASAPGSGVSTLNCHDVVIDSNGHLLSWIQPQSVGKTHFPNTRSHLISRSS